MYRGQFYLDIQSKLSISLLPALPTSDSLNDYSIFAYDKDGDGYHIPPSALLAVIRPRCKVFWIPQGHRLGPKEEIKGGKKSTIEAEGSASDELDSEKKKSEFSIYNAVYFTLLYCFYLCVSFYFFFN